VANRTGKGHFGKGKDSRRGKGGRRNPPGGRTPNWFKEKMQELAASEAAVEFISDCIKGQPVDEFLVLATGVQVPVKPSAAVRLKAWTEAADRGFGKPTPMLPDGGLTAISLVELIRRAEEERGLDRSA
jgi:hypothetical protein